MKYSYSKLKGKIAEVFGTQERFAQAIGISPAALSASLITSLGLLRTKSRVLVPP